MSDGRSTVKSPAAAARPRTEQRAARRAGLVDAAVAAIRTHGPDVAMEDIAAQAGVSKPILYRHFGDKAGLYMAVSEWATQQLRTALLAGLDPAGEPREMLRTVIDTYLRFIDEQPDLYRFVVRRSFADRPVEQDPVTTHKELVAAALAEIFGARLRSVGLDAGGAETWAHAGVGMVQAAGDWWLERRTLPRDTVRDHLLLIACGAMEAVFAGRGPR